MWSRLRAAGWIPADVDGRALGALVACVGLMWAHQAVRWDWFIDDAAICFAYARNFVEGHGLVPFPGGERVEGYSDPLYILLLALFQAVGLNGFTVAKPLALLFGVGTAWLTFRLARRVLPAHAGRGALLAPLVLATSAQFALWSTSGLENALFCLILTGAVVRTLEEVDDGGPPFSAVLYVLLCWTRPEGMLYAGVGGVVYTWGTYLRSVRTGGSPVRAVVIWMMVLGVPLGVAQIARMWYFAWPVANTYYAKSIMGLYPFDWYARGWVQIREWADELWHGFLLPIYLLGVVGIGRARSLRIAAGVVGVLALLLLWPGPAFVQALPFWPELPNPPIVFVRLRVYALLAAAVLLPLLAVGQEGGLARLLTSWTTLTGLWFLIYANGDWMGAYRFLSLIAPTLSVLFAAGLVELADAVERATTGRPRWTDAGWLVAVVGVGLLVPPNLWQVRDHIYYSINETPASVKQRADYTRSIQRRTFWDDPVVNLEVDLGAHIWFNPDYREVDLAMLMDVALAHHWYQQRPFVREYIFREHSPTFGHVGGWWGDYTGLRRYPEWDQTMFELPGYDNVLIPPTGWFKNVFARRSMVMAPQWKQAERRKVTFDWKITMEGWEQPAPWAPGEPGYLEVPFSVQEKRAEGTDVQVIAFLAQGDAVVASWSLPMGYGFYPMHWWQVGQVFRGRHAVDVPRSVQPGRYDLGFVITGPRGRVIPALGVPAGATTEAPVLAAGEVRFAGAIEVLHRVQVDERRDAVRADFERHVAAVACEAAERTWIRFQRFRPEDWNDHDAQRPRFAGPLASCWARKAEQEQDRAIDWLARAHRWDPRNEDLARIGAPVAQRLLAQGRTAREAADWDAAFDAYSATLRFQPWQAWARRWAEEARDQRLGLADDVRIGGGGENDLRALEQRGR